MAPEVPFTDLGMMAQEIWPDVAADMLTTVSTASFIGGAAVERFEEEWARYCGVPHAVGVANGTDALQLTLRALGVGPGDEVVVPSSTFVATAEAVVLAGAVPRFADVDAKTMLLSGDSLAAAITAKTRGVIAVHLYGQVANMDELARVARHHGIFLVEDAAQAHGGRWHGRPVGSFGEAACFSFYPGKNLGAFGDAGAVVTRNKELADQIRSMANHGRSDASHYHHVRVGTNSRLDAIQALVLRAKLARLPAWTDARRQLAARYRDKLSGLPEVTVVDLDPLSYHVYHLFVIRVSERERVTASLSQLGIRTGVHYPLPCHQQPAFSQFAWEPLPNSELAAAEVLSLPLYPHMSSAQVDRVVEALGSVMAERGGLHVSLA
jgi:dTDP-4-amino-4,6-dideoxygalactose transaminase